MNEHDFTNTETWLVWLWYSDNLLERRESYGDLTPLNVEAYTELRLEMVCDGGLEGNLLRLALSKVDWHQIADYVNS
jgi:hypothetical protein